MAHLTVRGVRSYAADKDVCFDLSNQVTLIYGQNGSGKSTISGFFSGYRPEKYTQCRFVSEIPLDYLVFSQEYVDRTFYKESYQPGIFTLSEQNLELQNQIEVSQQRIEQISQDVQALNEELKNNQQMTKTVKEDCASKIFDRTINERKIFDVFMTNAKQKRTFYEKIIGTESGSSFHTTESLQQRLHHLIKSKDTRHPEIPAPVLRGIHDEQAGLMLTPLVPSSGSQFSAFIQNMGNGDWIRAGSRYIEDSTCPFCQQSFDSAHFLHELERMFDKSYTDALELIKAARIALKEDMDVLTGLRDTLLQHAYVNEKQNIVRDVENLLLSLESNIQMLESKSEQPSGVFRLHNTQESQHGLFKALDELNLQIRESNRLADNYETEVQQLQKDVFCHLKSLSAEHLQAQEVQLEELQRIYNDRSGRSTALLTERQILSEETGDLISQLSVIQPTVDAINEHLQFMGMTGFSLCCHDEKMKLYKLKRDSDPHDEKVFTSLSEGEKSIISLLYFIESCTGNVSPEPKGNSKIIVIDDPISSLSHNYIYEVASLIKRKIIQPRIAKHVVILTHNIFFFHEILLSAVRRLSPDARSPKHWTLLRIVKNSYSDCVPLSMHEMLNEYQALWQILRDVREGRAQPVVLLNTMRNILEYYFSFACKEERLEKALEQLAQEHAAGQFDSFFRAVNRHSHSDGRNILSGGFLEPENYFRLFRKIFEATEDTEHYDKMFGNTSVSNPESEVI
ncbi:AAA family ATPase [Cronobacter dublinensis]